MKPEFRGAHFAWSLSDQALSTGTNFMLSLFAARLLSTKSFGLFSLIYLGYAVVLSVVKNLTTDPLTLRYGSSPCEQFAEEARAAAGAALVVVLPLCFLSIIVFAGTGGFQASPPATAYALLLLVPGLVLQDSYRHISFASRRPHAATAIDAAWAGAQAIGIVFLVSTETVTLARLLLVWAAAANLSALFAANLLDIRPSVDRGRAWVSRHFGLSRHLLLESSSTFVAPYAVTYIVGAFVGLAGVAAIRGAQVLLGPLNVVQFAVQAAAQVELVRMYDLRDRRFRRMAVVLASFLGALPLAVAAVANSIPDRLGQEILGASWVAAQEAILPIAIYISLSGIIAVMGMALRAADEIAAAVRLRLLVVLPAVLVGGIIGAAQGSGTAAAWGIAAGNLLGAVGYILRFRQIELATPRVIPEE